MVNVDAIRKNYPLHWLVWHNSYVELDKELSSANQVCCTKQNPAGSQTSSYLRPILIRRFFGFFDKKSKEIKEGETGLSSTSTSSPYHSLRAFNAILCVFFFPSDKFVRIDVNSTRTRVSSARQLTLIPRN